MNNSNKKCQANVMNISAKFHLYPLYGFWGGDFSIFFRKLSLSNICVKLLSKYLQWDSNKCHFFIFPHYKSMATVSHHSNQRSDPIKIKTPLFVPPAHRYCMWNLERIGFMALEEMSFENVDRWRRTDGQRMPAYTITPYELSAQVS